MNRSPRIKKRIVATLIDLAIYLPLFLTYTIYFGEVNDEGESIVSGVMTLPIFIFWLLYFPITEVAFGNTLGHKLMGLKVVTLSGRPISFLQAFKRRILDGIEIYGSLGIIAYIVAKNSPREQRVGDSFARTKVIGGDSVFCKNCNEPLELSGSDIIKGQFNCPECQTTNRIE
jgi:uncharacterized RDD family membrane protein YckC